MTAYYVGLEEEATAYGVEESDGVGGGTPIYFKVLSESMQTTRTDFFPETTEYWTTADKAEGYFSSGGTMEGLVDPVQFPKLLVLFIGDGTPNQLDSSIAYDHLWKFGANETVAATGIKPFTYFKGTGIEKDRMFEGCFITDLSIEAVNKEIISYTATIAGNGNETLITAKEPTYAAYTQPYLTFSSATLFTVGSTDRLTTAPTVEAFRLNCSRGYDTDHYVLGKRYLSAQTLSGMASVTGSMDFSWTSQDEHERFLSAVGTYETGDQANFTIDMVFKGAQIVSPYNYQMVIRVSDAYYTASSGAELSGRDRLTQTVDFRGNYDATSSSAVYFYARNIVTAYTSLS